MTNDERDRFLASVSTPPARLTVPQVAWLLNCQPHDIPVLVSARLLRPLGNPSPNGIKFFCTAAVVELAQDRAWLAKMTNAVSRHWQTRNARRKAVGGNAAPGLEQADEAAA